MLWLISKKKKEKVLFYKYLISQIAILKLINNTNKRIIFYYFLLIRIFNINFLFFIFFGDKAVLLIYSYHP